MLFIFVICSLGALNLRGEGEQGIKLSLPRKGSLRTTSQLNRALSFTLHSFSISFSQFFFFTYFLFICIYFFLFIIIYIFPKHAVPVKSCLLNVIMGIYLSLPIHTPRSISIHLLHT